MPKQTCKECGFEGWAGNSVRRGLCTACGNHICSCGDLILDWRSTTCQPCAARENGGLHRREMSAERRHWTEELIIEAFQLWVLRHDEPPTFKQAENSSNRGDLPPPCVVQRRFGTWNKGIAAAGFSPRPASWPPKFVVNRKGKHDRSRQMVTGGKQGAKRYEPIK